MWFDESDGSQREQLPHVLNEPSPEELIKKMGAGDIKPVEYVVEETHIPPAPDENPNPEANDPDAHEETESEESDPDEVPQIRRPAHPRIANEVQIDKILDDINAPGPLTRARANRIANFCGHFAFVSISEPTKVAEAFQEAEWIQAMQDELLQFKLQDVWELVKRPDPRIHNVIGTK